MQFLLTVIMSAEVLSIREGIAHINILKRDGKYFILKDKTEAKQYRRTDM